MITNINEYKKILENVEFISLNRLIEIADKAGKIVPDAKDTLEELGTAYGDRIPKPLVDDILFNYDLEDINESKAKNKYVSNKISTLMDEGKPHKQAVAIAISMWEQKQKKKKKKTKNESLDNTSFSKGDKITIDMGNGPEEVIIDDDFNAGNNKIQFIKLKTKRGAPYTITSNKLKNVILKHNESFLNKDITISKKLAIDIITKHINYNNSFKDKIGNFINKDIESNKHLEQILSELDNSEIEKILLMI